jgi:hypothetical protein
MGCPEDEEREPNTTAMGINSDRALVQEDNPEDTKLTTLG